MIFAYDKDGITATEWVPNDVTVTAAYNQKFIRSALHPQNWKLLSEKIDRGELILHDNVHPHVAQPVVNLFID